MRNVIAQKYEECNSAGLAIGINQTLWDFVELLQILFSFFKVNKLERDTNKHNDPAKDTTDLVPIYQDNLTKLSSKILKRLLPALK